MKLALVHDHLVHPGGAESVLQVMQDIWPEAPTYALVYNPERFSAMANRRVIPSFLQRFPGARRHPQWYLPFMPTATESYDLRGFDAVLSSCSAFAKGVLTRSNTVHVCYCHTPTRYLWSDTHQYVNDLPYPRPAKWAIRRLLTRLRAWDQLAAQRVDRFVANSRNVAERIAKYYRRESAVIHPPVAVDQFHLSDKPGRYFLTGGRLVPYKRFDLVVAAFNRLGLPLKIFGQGPEYPRLKQLAKRHIEFVGYVDRAALAALYAQCLAFIHPQVEDFGITAVEAMASARPVIAYVAGGAIETVVPGVTGVLFEEQSWEALADAVIRFRPEQFVPADIRRHAEQFGENVFRQRIRELVESEWHAVQARRWPIHQAVDAIREGRAVVLQPVATGDKKIGSAGAALCRPVALT